MTLVAGTLAAVGPPPLELAGVSASLALVTPAGATVSQSLAALFADAITPEAFGAVGDGITDDSAALGAAIASLRPVRLAPRGYAVSGQWTIPFAAVLIGTPGRTILRRVRQARGGAWISVQGSSFSAHGITFDANRASIPQESWGRIGHRSLHFEPLHSLRFCKCFRRHFRQRSYH